MDQRLEREKRYGSDMDVPLDLSNALAAATSSDERSNSGAESDDITSRPTQDKPQVYKCNSCRIVCADLFDLAIHINENHLEQKMYRCEECKSTHFNISALEGHLESCSNEGSTVCRERYGCNVFNCGSAFYWPNSLSYHLEFHFVEAGVEFFNSSYWAQEEEAELMNPLVLNKHQYL